MAITTFVFLIRTVAYRFEIDFVLLALSVAFLCREIHFAGTQDGVYIAAGLIVFWSGFRNEKLFKELECSKPVKIVLFGTGWSYLLALLIQRRFFKSIFKELHMNGLLTIEKELHTPLEEMTENTAHLFFLLLAVVCFTLSKQAKKSLEQGCQEKVVRPVSNKADCDGNRHPAIPTSHGS